METINFTIPFGDTSDPKKVAEEIARDHQFRSWFLRKSEDSSDEEGVAVVKFTIMGWPTEW